MSGVSGIDRSCVERSIENRGAGEDARVGLAQGEKDSVRLIGRGDEGPRLGGC